MTSRLPDAWRRFWGLSWWWKGSTLGGISLLVIATIIISVIMGGGDDNPIVNEGVQAPTHRPTSAPIATPTRQATPTPSPHPTPAGAPTETPGAAVAVSTPEEQEATGGTNPILVGAGDIASCSGTGDEATAELLDAIFAGGAHGNVFTAGDNAYDSGAASEFADCYEPAWGRHKDRTRPAAGNHDYLTASASGYFDYFRAAAGDPGKGYYSYDLGSWHIVVINSNCSEVGGCGAGSPQEQWLRADLAANPAFCTLAYWHRPRFSSGTHGSSTSVQAIWQALYDHGADAVINGHDHDYERFAPQDPKGVADPERGIRQFVVGTGGKSHYSFPGPPIANSEVRNDETFGVLKLTLNPMSLDWQFVSVVGETFSDSGSQSCH